MPKVYTHFNTPEAIPTPSGDDYLDIFQEEISKKDGKRNLIAIGKKNIKEFIQKDLESTKIENILQQVAMGDLSALRKEEPIYIDATSFPKTLMEAQNIVIKAKQEFEKMPGEVKKLFDNDPEKYISEMGTKDFIEKIAPYNKKMADIKEAGSVKAYNEKVAAQAKFESDVAKAKGVTNES